MKCPPPKNPGLRNPGPMESVIESSTIECFPDILANIFTYRKEGNVFIGVYQSFCSQSVTAHPCFGAVGTHLTGMLSC